MYTTWPLGVSAFTLTLNDVSFMPCGLMAPKATVLLPTTVTYGSSFIEIVYCASDVVALWPWFSIITFIFLLSPGTNVFGEKEITVMYEFCSPAVVALTAAKASTRPAPTLLFLPAAGLSAAVVSMISVILAGVREEFFSNMRAITPATQGVDCEVPSLSS